MIDCRCTSHNGFLTSRGYREVAQRELEFGLAPRGVRAYVDRVVSVSALIEIENDSDYDANHIELNRRFIHHGS